MYITTVAQEIASAIEAMHNCIRNSERNPHLAEWISRHRQRAENLTRDYLPSGSGVDSGTTLDVERSHGDKLVFSTSFHHMDDGGGYDGWTDHVVTVRPAFQGFDIKISGRDRNDIKELLHDLFTMSLGRSLSEEERKASCE